MFETDTFMAAPTFLALGIALIAGLFSFLSPCVLPVAAPYLAYMGGVSVTDMETDRAGRRRVLLAAVFFVLGLSTVFLILGLGASALGRQILPYKNIAETVAAILILIFGAHFVGAIRIPFLLREARIGAQDKGGSAFGAYLLGLAFAFGWTPCLGPILSAILGIAAMQADLVRGTALLAAYALGLGLPFLLLAAFFPRLKPMMAFMRRHMEQVERISGLLLWTIGLMMLTGQFTALSGWLLDTIPILQTLG